MFPVLFSIGSFQVYSFGITITACFFLFVWMLWRMSSRLNYDFSIFKNNILWFFISVFFFSRLFYVFANWNDLKYIQNFLEFFIMDGYKFSLIGAIIGFFLVLFLILKLKKEKIEDYIYPVVLSFIFILPLGYFGALFGGTVYGIDTNFGFEITYERNDTPVPYTSPLFPLPIFYAILFFLEFCFLYIANMYFKEKKILGYMGILIFSCLIFIMEFLSGKNDIFKDFIFLNMNQIFAIIFFAFAFVSIYKYYKRETRGTRLIR